MVNFANETLPHLPDVKDMAKAYADVLRPLPKRLPSEFAAEHRKLKEGTTEQPGPWSNDVYPYLVDIMDAIDEALRTGKRGVVLIKSGQGGGSEAMINALCYLLAHYPGPALYLISKDELAREFGRERFGHIIDTCEPLKRKALIGRGAGQLTHIKRFADGKLVIQGGRSVNNLQSVPYKFVIIDEVDSLADELEGQDPIKMAEIRTDSYSGPTLIIAFAHPTTRSRGAGRLYYDLSDQRRPHVTCPHCGGSFWMQWAHVTAIPKDGMNEAQAKRDPKCYEYHAPCCGMQINDAQRYSMIRQVPRQKSVLAPDVAARKTWIGVHFSQLYMMNKPLAFLAEKWIEGIDNEPVKRVFVNKRMGDVYDAAVKETSADSWRSLVVISRGVSDLEYYELGQVPRGVRLLTAGQDSRAEELHYAIWGWGLIRDEGNWPVLCGWLVDAGVIRRAKSLTLDASELRVFDQLIYDRAFIGTDGQTHFYVEQGFHDSGWQPIAAYEYCRTRPFRAFPSKGAAEDSSSSAPFLRWGAAPSWRIGNEEVRDPSLKMCLLNTYTLKEAWFGLVTKKFKRVRAPGLPAEPEFMLHLPRNVDALHDDQGVSFIDQSSSEYLTVEKKKFVWKHKGPNHWSDCGIYAYASALNLNIFQSGLPFDEALKQAEQKAKDEQGYIPGSGDSDSLMM